MKKHPFILIASFIILHTLLAANASASPAAQSESPTPTQGPAPTPAEVINAINELRLSHGIAPLAVHSVLMQVGQTEADGIASGREGHWRPEGLTLGQWLISLGYPLSGDLSLDGYRSENWGFASTAEEAVNMWLGDDEHTNTMLSLERSDIGAGIATMGDGTYVVVVETALRTASGQMQYDAYAILTGIPLTQAAYSSMATQAAENGLLPQGMAPVFLSTALPDGRVYHEVKYGQTLWGIAITYGTTIKKLQQLNRLSDTTVQTGQKLLIMESATQPAPASISPTPVQSPRPISTPTISSAQTATPEPTRELTPEERQRNTMTIVAIGIAALFLGGVFTVMTRKKQL
ncbi:MAG: LysM peptidoglycan-binding domain-containing protein [Chloroflexi bacterium]|nr:LysM peptidoglycan-binding domain-containing protein [Chloroflexota bacterium]